MAIRPVDLPSGAGVNFGEGDVRHMSEGDAIDVPGMQGPTRQLAERDNVLARKLNETIEIVNNREQIIPIPIPRTTLGANEEFLTSNYRIPQGFEARVLNAAVAAFPSSANVELNILYAAGFGNSTGVALVTTADEFTAGTSFKQAGEFIISIKNKGSTSLDVTTSVILTMRPVGEAGTLLVGSTVKGDKGAPGMTGGLGPRGLPGTGGAGSPGMVWTGDWVNGRNYSQKEVVAFPLFGTVTSSYICIAGHAANSSNQPPNTAFWNTVAQGSSGSVTGVAGQAGPPGTSPLFAFNTINGTFTASSTDFFSEEGTGDLVSYIPGPTPGGNLIFPVQECFVGTNAGSPQGAAFLFGQLRLKCRGHGTVTLPSVAFGAKVNYTNTAVMCATSVEGTVGLNAAASRTGAVAVQKVASNQYSLFVMNGTNTPIAIQLMGVQAFG